MPDPAAQELTELERLVVHLFLEAEHDHARVGMLMTLRDFFGLGHNMGDWEEVGNPTDAQWEQAVRAVLGSVPHHEPPNEDETAAIEANPEFHATILERIAPVPHHEEQGT